MYTVDEIETIIHNCDNYKELIIVADLVKCYRNDYDYKEREEIIGLIFIKAMYLG